MYYVKAQRKSAKRKKNSINKKFKIRSLKGGMNTTIFKIPFAPTWDVIENFNPINETNDETEKYLLKLKIYSFRLLEYTNQVNNDFSINDIKEYFKTLFALTDSQIFYNANNAKYMSLVFSSIKPVHYSIHLYFPFYYTPEPDKKYYVGFLRNVDSQYNFSDNAKQKYRIAGDAQKSYEREFIIKNCAIIITEQLYKYGISLNDFAKYYDYFKKYDFRYHELNLVSTDSSDDPFESKYEITYNFGKKLNNEDFNKFVNTITKFNKFTSKYRFKKDVELTKFNLKILNFHEGFYLVESTDQFHVVYHNVIENELSEIQQQNLKDLIEMIDSNPSTTPSSGSNPSTTPSSGSNPSTTPSSGSNPSTTPSSGSNPSTTPSSGSNPSTTPSSGSNLPTTPDSSDSLEPFYISEELKSNLIVRIEDKDEKLINYWINTNITEDKLNRFIEGLIINENIIIQKIYKQRIIYKNQTIEIIEKLDTGYVKVKNNTTNELFILTNNKWNEYVFIVEYDYKINPLKLTYIYKNIIRYKFHHYVFDENIDDINLDLFLVNLKSGDHGDFDNIEEKVELKDAFKYKFNMKDLTISNSEYKSYKILQYESKFYKIQELKDKKTFGNIHIISSSVMFENLEQGSLQIEDDDDDVDNINIDNSEIVDTYILDLDEDIRKIGKYHDIFLQQSNIIDKVVKQDEKDTTIILNSIITQNEIDEYKLYMFMFVRMFLYVHFHKSGSAGESTWHNVKVKYDEATIANLAEDNHQKLAHDLFKEIGFKDEKIFKFLNLFKLNEFSFMNLYNFVKEFIINSKIVQITKNEEIIYPLKNFIVNESCHTYFEIKYNLELKDDIKNHFNDILNYYIMKNFNKSDLANKNKIKLPSLNLVLKGNPGTGKSTIAKQYVNFLKCLQIVEKGLIQDVNLLNASKLIHKDKKDVQDIIEQCINAKLPIFIDEAHMLEPKINEIGKYIIGRIMEYTDVGYNKDNPCVILAGYSDEIQKNLFEEGDKGLQERLALSVDLPNWNYQRIYDKLISELKHWNTNLDNISNCFNNNIVTIDVNSEEAVKKYFVNLLAKYYVNVSKSLDKNFANGRYIMNQINKANRRVVERLKEDDKLINAEQFKYCITDFLGENPKNNKKLKKIRDEIDEKYKGLDEKTLNFDNNNIVSPKVGIDMLIKKAQTRYDNIMRGIPPGNDFGGLNVRFIGNPGTGKTTFAKYYAQVLGELQLLSRPNLIVETSGSKLKSENTNGSSKKTRDLINSAKGGILIIDEFYAAYSKLNDSISSSTKEVINAITEENSNSEFEDMAIVVLGYKKDMDEFIDNPEQKGLTRRFIKQFYFNSFSEENLISIVNDSLDKYVKNGSVKITDDGKFEYFKNLLVSKILYEKEVQKELFGNMGYIENLIINVLDIGKIRETDTGIEENTTLFQNTDDIIKLHSRFPIAEDQFDEQLENFINEECYEIFMYDGYYIVPEEINVFLSIIFTNANKHFQNIKNKLDSNQIDKSIFKPYKLENFVITGNPGVGKTVLIKSLYKIFSKFNFITNNTDTIYSAKELAGQYIGETDKKMKKIFNSYLGGLIVIDEAHNLEPSVRHNYDDEVVKTLGQSSTAHPYEDKLTFGFLGTPDNMQQKFSEYNIIFPGFQRRFWDAAVRLHLPKYKKKESFDLLTALITANSNLKYYIFGDPDSVVSVNPDEHYFGNFNDLKNYRKNSIVSVTKEPVEEENDDDIIKNTHYRKKFKVKEDIEQEAPTLDVNNYNITVIKKRIVKWLNEYVTLDTFNNASTITQVVYPELNSICSRKYKELNIIPIDLESVNEMIEKLNNEAKQNLKSKERAQQQYIEPTGFGEPVSDAQQQHQEPQQQDQLLVQTDEENEEDEEDEENDEEEDHTGHEHDLSEEEKKKYRKETETRNDEIQAAIDQKLEEKKEEIEQIKEKQRRLEEEKRLEQQKRLEEQKNLEEEEIRLEEAQRLAKNDAEQNKIIEEIRERIKNLNKNISEQIEKIKIQEDMIKKQEQDILQKQAEQKAREIEQQTFVKKRQQARLMIAICPGGLPFSPTSNPNIWECRAGCRIFWNGESFRTIY